LKSRFLQLPFRRGHAGGAAEIDDIDRHIKDKMMQILFTIPGERVNLPDFGCGLYDLLFEGNNQVLVSTARFKIQRALTRWIGDEVDIEGVEVFHEEETLYIQIFYRRLDNRIPDRLEIAYKL
jgi:phage baseplate assembly protein W